MAADRLPLDAQRALRTTVLLLVTLGVGSAINLMDIAGHASLRPHTWLYLRVGFVLPGLAILSILTTREFGRRHLQALLTIGTAGMVGAFALEFIIEWEPTDPFRNLWVATSCGYFGAVALLPLTQKSATWATIGAFSIALAGCAAILPRLGWIHFLGCAFIYIAVGSMMIVHVGWRERLQREAFFARREVELLAAELQRKNEDLQNLVAQRSEFVNGVLHDLRSPLTGIILGTKMLRDCQVIPVTAVSERELLERVVSSARRVETFANNFLRRESLERTASAPELSPVEFCAIVKDAAAHARTNSESKQQRLRVINDSPDVRVLADEVLLDRAVGNLLDNAIKYSPPGAEIVVRIYPDPSDYILQRLAVIDIGPGLSAEEQARLFQPFVTLEKRPTGDELATGLGLSLVKRLVEAMGGTVGCDSKPGQGATFWLSLRRAEAPKT